MRGRRQRGMAGSAPWLRWNRRDLGDGSRETKRWEEEEQEEEEDFEEHMDKDGVIGLEEGLVTISGRPGGSRFVEALSPQALDPPTRVRRFSYLEQPEFGPEESGADGEDTGSPAPGDIEDPSDRAPTELAYWRPRRDATEEEEEEEQGSSEDEGRPEGTSGAESDSELYPELSYEGQCGSEYSGSPEALRDSPALLGPCAKSLSFSTDGGEASVLSDASPGASPPCRRMPGRAESRWLSPPAAAGPWGRDRSLVSTEDLRDARSDTRSITAEPCATAGAKSGREPRAGTLPPDEEQRRAGGGIRPRGRTRAAVKAAPQLLQGRQCRSLSPRRPRSQGATTTMARSRAAGPTASKSPCYGRGPLNHPLPDLSKVEARVKVAQSYRPPRGRALLTGSPHGPVLPKSPAEIVREALLSSSGRCPRGRPVPSAARTLGCPEEASELVQQLQDDYHKLLTKYAEAENTIDQLRLGAKVSLYADPPKPSHSVHMGTLGTGSKVMAFSIPQSRTAAISTAPVPALQPFLGEEPAQEPVNQGTSPRPHSPPFPGMGCSACPGQCGCQGQHPCPGIQLTQTLAGQTHKFQAQVESFEAWVQAGNSTPQEQLQRFRKLKNTQDALERTYLQAREENRRLQQHQDSSGEFDPDRTVEGEIFCMGMRLEELKDRLERAARRQPSPHSCSEAGSSPSRSPVPLSETRVSSPTPSLQAPMPAVRTPYTESPALQEMLLSTRPGTGGSSASGDSEAGGGELLPEPLWHKRLQVEEDFGDLLEQYKHFKSLPESLSLEQLSRGGSQSPEEVDGLRAGESGLDKVSCRTQPPEERGSLPTSALQPPKGRAGLLPHTEPAWKKGHLSRAGSEELPRATEAPAGLPEPRGRRMPLSQGSSAVGNAEHQPRRVKPTRAEEQRIVSPETDSGFVGSETSRVSPLMHVPELRPPRAGTPGLPGRSDPISTAVTLHPLQKREAAPLCSKTAPMGIYTSCGQGPPQDGTRGPSLPPSTPSHTNSSPQWADSVTSDMAPDADGTHTDSAVEERSSAGYCSHPPGKAGAPTAPDQAPCDLLGSRVERDRAIRALQDEVSRLQQRLEQSLRWSRSYPEGKAPLRTAKAPRQTLGNGLSCKEPAASEEPSAAARGRPAPTSKAARRGRSAPPPRDRPELLLRKRDCAKGSAASDCSPSRPRDGWPRAVLSPRKSPRSPRDTVTMRGQYTGTRYHTMPLAAPRAEQGAEQGAPGCPQGCGSRLRASSSVGDAVQWPQQSTPSKTHCPMCQSPRDTPAPSTSNTAAHAERRLDGASAPGSRAGPKAETLEQPGLWYLAASPPAAALGYLAPVPVVSYTPSVLYCSPTVSTSAPVLAGLPLHPAPRYPLAERTPPATRQQAASRRLTLDLSDLEELNWSLARAVEAAKSVKFTTKQMSRSLTSELSKVRDLRGSCLF